MSTAAQSSSSISSTTVPNHLLRQALESLASSSSAEAPFLKPGQTTSTKSVDQPTMVSLMASASPPVYNAPQSGCPPAAAEQQSLTSEKITNIANEALRIMQQAQGEPNQPVAAQETTNGKFCTLLRACLRMTTYPQKTRAKNANAAQLKLTLLTHLTTHSH